MVALSKISQHVFVDESGDPNLNISLSGVSNFFVLAAVIVNSNDLGLVEAKAKNLIADYCQSGELKSSKIKNKNRRKEIIKAIIDNLDIKVYALVVDKSEIFPDSGLQYKKSFLKFLNGRLYNPLYKTFHELHVKADEHGRTEFMESFEKYIKNKHTPNLFEQSSFEFVSSQSYPLVQIADLFAGTLSRCYSGKDPESLIKAFLSKTILIEQWPPSIKLRTKHGTIDETEKFNYIAREQGANLAKIFIENFESDKDPDRELQIETLKYLLYHFNVVNPEAYIPAGKIVSYLHSKSITDQPISPQVFKTKVIAQIRDEGVIIASSGKGYKIPYTGKDILDYVNNVSHQVVPSLHRLNIARKQILLASKGEFEIVGEEEFAELFNLIKTL